MYKMDSNSMYNNNDTSSHGGPGNFVNGSGSYRNGGSHSASESARLLNQNSSYGAQYTPSDKAFSQGYGCENNGNVDSPYSNWQGLNSSSNSSNNNWNIPDSSSGKPSAARGLHGSSQENSASGDENMLIDNEASAFSGLLGATGGTDYSDDKSNVSNNFAGNSPRPMHLPRIGLLGGGESSLTSQPSGWTGSQGPASAVSGWVGGNRQNNSDMTGGSNSENMMVDNDMGFSELLGATGGADFPENKQNGGNNAYRQDHSIPSPRLGLLGGGEGNMNSAPNGWMNPTNSGNSASGWGTGVRTSTNNSAMSEVAGASGSGTSPTKPQGSWAQAAGKGLNSNLPPCTNGNGTVQNGATNMMSESQTVTQDNAAARTVEDQAKEIRLKAAFSDGWGQNTVDQDTPWDVPSSPPPENGKEANAMWRAPVNLGTEIWENNLRINKGSCPPVNVPVTTAPPWGHTPSSNIGGHWGDDDSSNNMWSGVPQNTGANPASWSETNVPSNPNMWGNAVPSEKHWSGNGASSWNEGPNADNGTTVWNATVNKGRPVGNWSPMATPKKEMPPSGWEPPSPPTGRRPQPSGGNYDDGTAVWGNPQRQGKVSHWKDMPAAKPIMNSTNNMVGPNGVPMANLGGMQPSGPGMIRLPSGNKGDVGNSVWSKQAPPMGRSSGWQDMPPHRDSPTIGNWGDENHMHNQMKAMSGQQGGPYNGGWNEQTNNPLSYWGAKPKPNSNWADGQVDTSSWLGPSKQGGKPLCRDLIWASKQFRVLVECGFKKEDAENALRNNNMNLDDALTELRSGMPMDNMMDLDGRKMRLSNMGEDLSMPDHNLDSAFPNFHGPNNFQAGVNFANMQTFKQANKNNVLGAAFGNQSRLGHNFPSAAQLRHLVQQIQMAVQAGHLNPQILNQPLAPQTLLLLYQLLQQIKSLSQLQQQVYQNQHLQKPIPGVANGNTGLQLNVQLTQTKQKINNLQNQIAANQAVFLKAQVPQPLQAQALHSAQASNDIFKPNIEGMPALHNEFRDLSLKDVAHQNNQSRLNQWKLFMFEKDENQMCQAGDSTQGALGAANEFSRAPGPSNSKQAANTSVPNSGNGLHTLLGQGDSAWSNLSSRPHGDSGWPEAVSSDGSTNNSNSTPPSMMNNGQPSGENKDVTQSSSAQASGAAHVSSYLTDLVPEFEPGKPWKGTQMKNVEDDPHITPGSITRSPLSVNTIKDSTLLWNSKTSPANTSSDTSGSLTSSTWVFNPPTTAGPNSSSGPGKLGKSSWGSDLGTGSDLWGSSISKPRGPPPGISSTQGWDRQANSTFLILRNLTPQIDGSTLKTLCMQHGPLQMFHLSLNRGVALVRYSTREEASKAQSALNNCVLGNTTMLADIPSEGEIQQHLQLSSGQAGANTWSSSQQPQGGATNNNGANANYHNAGSSSYYGGSSGNGAGGKLDVSGWNGNVPSSQLWPFSNSSLWSSSQPINEHDPSTNPMNSYLPGDLLGGEPM